LVDIDAAVLIRGRGSNALPLPDFALKDCEFMETGLMSIAVAYAPGTHLPGKISFKQRVVGA
jgi:hypothetical protein